MTLPNDMFRCRGESDEGGPICEHRDTCARYLAHAAEKGEYYRWYCHPQIPGPCVNRIEIRPPK